MSAKNLADLSGEEFKSFFDSFDNIFCDCDGVLWTEPNIKVPGVSETLTALKEHGKKIRFVTNNAVRGIELFYKRFQGHNYVAEREDIIYPTPAIINYLKKMDFDKELYVIGGTEMKKDLRNAGFKLAELESDNIQENVMEIMKFLKDNPKVGGVIFDFDLNINYAKLLTATVYLRRPEVLFIKGGTDKKLAVDGKSFLVGHGYFQEIAEDMTGRKGLCFGKPGLHFNEYLKERFGITDPSRTLFVGDTMEQDVGFGNDCGYQTLLVLTGSAKLDHLEKCTTKSHIPDFYVNTFGDLHELIKNKL